MRPHLSIKTPWSRPLGDVIQPVIDPVLTRRGLGLTGLVLFWDDIVGEELAAISRPVKIQQPFRHRGAPGNGKPAPAALVVRADPSCALEMQHLAPVILERINAQFGWRCIARLVLMQGPVPAFAAARRTAAQPLDQAAEVAAAAVAGNGLDPSLHQALVRLGARVLARP
jgi:hypothetical protein